MINPHVDAENTDIIFHKTDDIIGRYDNNYSSNNFDAHADYRSA